MSEAEPSNPGRDARLEVCLNLAAGLSVLSWAVLGLRDSWLVSGHVGIVRGCGSAIHVCAGVLFLVRRPLVAEGSTAQLALALPSFIAGGLAYRWAPQAETWPPAAVGVFVVGGVVTVVSLMFLGRSFAVLPALREVVVRGPYRWLRHPAYAGEVVMVMAMVMAASLDWKSVVALAVFVPAIGARLLAEEKVLEQSDDYRAYRERVRWRLLPGVW